MKPIDSDIQHGRRDKFMSYDDLSEAPRGNDAPDRAKTTGFSIRRDAAVRDYVIKRANGCCEYCNQPGFITSAGTPYLEAHHIIGLAEAGLPQLRIHHQSSSSSSSGTTKPSSAARNSSDVAASSRLVLMLVLMDLSSRMRLSAMWRTSARLWAMCPMRPRA